MHAVRRFVPVAVTFCVLCCALAGRVSAGGLDPESNTDGFDPAADSHRTGEAQRLNAIARQLDLVYQMQWENPYFPGGPPIRQPIGYESKQIGPNSWLYRPLYAEDVTPAADVPVETLPLPATPQAPAVGPRAPGPADALPSDFMPPKPKPPAARGPREF